MTGRVPDRYFAEMYEASSDPWHLGDRWYEARKYAITMAMLPAKRYRHAFEPGCSVGVLTEMLSHRCDRVTATDVVAAALEATRERLTGRATGVDLRRLSLDDEWPGEDVDLVVLSEVGYYLDASSLRRVLDRECPRLRVGATLVAAHWRHPVADYPLTGDEANFIVSETSELCRQASYRDADVAIDVFTVGHALSVAADTRVPGANS